MACEASPHFKKDSIKLGERLERNLLQSERQEEFIPKGQNLDLCLGIHIFTLGLGWTCFIVSTL